MGGRAAAGRPGHRLLPLRLPDQPERRRRIAQARHRRALAFRRHCRLARQRPCDGEGAMSELLILARDDLAALMGFADYVEAVAEGFRLHLEVGGAAPPPMQIAANGCAFHVKAATLPRGSGYVAVKINANFPENPRRRELPT